DVPFLPPSPHRRRRASTRAAGVALSSRPISRRLLGAAASAPPDPHGASFMRGNYILSVQDVTIPNHANVTLVGLRPGANCAIKVKRAWVSQIGASASAQQDVCIQKQVAAFGTLVAATPQPTSELDQASQIAGGAAYAAGTCGVAGPATTEGAGVRTVKLADAFNILNGWQWYPAPGGEIVLEPGSGSAFQLSLPTAPASLTGWNAGIEFEELG